MNWKWGLTSLFISFVFLMLKQFEPIYYHLYLRKRRPLVNQIRKLEFVRRKEEL